MPNKRNMHSLNSSPQQLISYHKVRIIQNMHNNEFKINWLINMLITLTWFNNGIHKIITHKYNKIFLPS